MQTQDLISVFSLLVWMKQCQAQQSCTFGPPTTNITCPTDGSRAAYCSSTSLGGNIILRCISGCPQPGNCNDNLAGVPPYGVKVSARCWQESWDAANAQCTVDCVNVTASNGTVFYPLGCSFTIQNGTGSPKSTSLTILGPSPTVATSASGSRSSSPTPSQSNLASAGAWPVGLQSAFVGFGLAAVMWAL